jgi:molecular chaperone HtpG
MSETLQFKTELKQLLHLIIHSLYSHKDIFLRELISNASDAIDTVRFQSLTNADLLEGDSDWKIRIIADEANGTLTVSDNGIGMSRATIVENLGTIAKSGTRALLESLKEAQAQNRPELIGQFGVGFYASFMVADKVTVISRTAGKPEDGVQWESDGQGEFSVEPVTKEKRGTDVILHLRADCKEYLQFWRIGQLVKKYSDFVEHPIVMKKEKEDGDQKSEVGDQKSEEETLNAMKAIWLRPRTEVTQEEYDAFYKHLSHDPEKPAKTVHYSAEGAIEFKALLYLPGHKPFDLMWGDKPKGLHLYIQRVFILDDYEILLPRYLRFVRGVVDSPDLPLNVSRELLQQSAPLEKIKTNLVNKILNTLDEMKKREYDEYVKFYEEMGVFLKEGVGQDWTNREKLADLLLFESTKTDKGKYTSLGQYLDSMPVNQPEIFYLTGDSRELMEQSPHLEAFREKGWEVLLLTEPVDEFVVDTFHEYKGKKLKAVDKGGLDTAAVEEDKKKQFKPLLDYFKEKLTEIKEARLTGRLKESAVCLVAEEGDMSAHMERLMQRMGRDRRNNAAPVTQRILEVNAEHPLIQNLEKIVEKDPQDARLEKTCRLLYDQAVITEGSKVKDPLAFAGRLNELIMRELGN